MLQAVGEAPAAQPASRADDFDPFEQLQTAGDAGTITLARFSDVRFAQAPDEPLPTPDEVLPTPADNNGLPANADDSAADWLPPPLGELTTNIRLPSGLLPRDHAAERAPSDGPLLDPGIATRGWPLSSLEWRATCFCHRPLYFEEINLERYGYGCGDCLQPAVSACHFFATVPALPYLMAVDCPCQCNYTLGHYRPGSCPPLRYHWPPPCH